MAEPRGDLGELTKPLLGQRAQYERVLLDRFVAFSVPQQTAALDILGRIGSEASMPLALYASLNPRLHRPAVQALAEVGDAETLARLAPKETDGQLQEELLAALLARGECRAVAAYLDLVTRPGLNGRPLAALSRVERPPVEMLFQFLEGPQVSRRLAAAVVLGRLDGPAITQRLIRLAGGGATHQEAMVALLASSNEEATQFVQNARQNLLLAGVLSAANSRYQSLVRSL